MRSAASDLGLHCLLVTCLGVSSLQWIEKTFKRVMFVCVFLGGGGGGGGGGLLFLLSLNPV